jgi:hypothetical protein
MALEASADGSSFSEIMRWDEAYFDTDSSEANNPNGVTYGHIIYDFTGMYLNPNFTFRFTWVTDASDNNYA